MKHSYHIKMMCCALLLIGFISMQAQVHKNKIQKQKSNTTIWDGSLWSNGIPTAQTIAIFEKSFTTNVDLTALAVELSPEVTLKFKDNAILKVIDEIKVPASAKLALEDNSQMLLKNPNATPPTVDIVRKTTKISKRDYTYFCSPVADQQLNLLTDYGFPVSSYNNDNGYLNGNPSPGTYNPPLFDKYFTWNESGTPVGTDALLLNTGKWVNISETTLMNPAGKGYIVRGPNSFPEVTPKQQWQVKFTGVVNTGTITPAISGNSYTPFSGSVTPYVPPVSPDPYVPYEPCNNGLYTWNLIGNPYPSMVDADTFLTNSSNIINLGGALYFWTHGSDFSEENGGNGTTVLNYTSDDYVIYNLTGGIGGTKRPNGKIATCQGFFTTGLTNSTATFTNDMKDTSLDGSINSQQFYRTNSQSMISPLTKSRIWISLRIGASVFKETLIGYIPGASTSNGNIAGSVNTYDKMYDTELVKTIYNTTNELNNRIELYSIINPTTPCPRLAIQGRQLSSSFNTDDTVSLGFSCPSGNYTFKLEDKDGLFGTQLIWLKEQTSPGVYVYYDDIRTTGHSFTSSGDSDNTTRFQIVFKLPTQPTIVYPVVCGTQIGAIETNLFTQNISGVSLYSFEVRTGGAYPGGTVLGTYSGNSTYPYQFNLNFSAINPNTTYWIRPASYKVNGQWQYGDTCQITTPPPPTSYVISPACGSTTSSRWARIDAQNIYAFGDAATTYRFKAFIGSTFFGQVDRTVPNCQLSQLGVTTAHTNTTFTITVDVFWRGAWQLGTVLCNITTANVLTRQIENNLSIFEVNAYPNPFANNFKLDINTTSEDQIELAVYDMLGRQIELRLVKISELDTQEIGENYTSGVYNVIVKQGDNIKTLRMIKR